MKLSFFLSSYFACVAVSVAISFSGQGCRFDPLAKVAEQTVCGDGVRQGNEACDGSDLGGKTCQSEGLGEGVLSCNPDCSLNGSSCAVQPFCGNDRAEGAEECDGSDLKAQTCSRLGFASGSLICSADCTLDKSGCQASASCGDGSLDEGEDCDDGNTVAGDGCGRNCREESGWSCEGEPSRCSPICGDGIVVSGVEECDDGNQEEGDGCSSDCSVEKGYWCEGEASTCHCRILVNLASLAQDPDGLTWDSALSALRSGLAAAADPPDPLIGPCEIWVAAGSYDPYVDSSDDSFDVPSGVALYGGFSGSETMRNERDFENNVTTLQTSACKSVLRAQSVSHVVVDGFVIQGGSDGAEGGGLFVQDSEIQVSHCRFSENQANHGGAVALVGASSVAILETFFDSNHAVDGDAGALLLRDSTVLVLQDCHFTANDSTVDGGAVSAWDDADLTVVRSVFENNSAGGSSGALWFGGRNGHVRESGFSGNRSSRTSGALGLFGDGEQEIADCDFQDNHGYYGGAVFIMEDRQGTISGSRFLENHAVYGGAVEVWGAELEVLDCVFDSNHAEGNGGDNNSGAIAVYDSRDNHQKPAFLSVSRSQFLHNTATRPAGAISLYWLGTGSCSGRIDNSLFWDNQVTGSGSGGAVLVSGAQAGLEFVNNTVVANQAGNNETGGLRVNWGTLHVLNSILWANSGRDLSQWQATLTVTHSDVLSNASSGGAWPGEGNIAEDPTFSSPSQGDFSLQSNSPCLDKAPDVGDASDLLGNPRNVDLPLANPAGLTVDMGCIEHQ